MWKRRYKRIYPSHIEVSGVGDDLEDPDLTNVEISLEPGYVWATITRIDGTDVIRLPGIANREYELDTEKLEQAIRDARAELARFEGAPRSAT